MRTLMTVFLMAVLLSSCSGGFEPINYGKDACAHCKMTIVDNRYAAELVTPKGKPFKFDDISCMKRYISEQKIDAKSQFFTSNFSKPGEPISAENAIYLKHDVFQSPMNGNFAAFSSKAEANDLMDSLGITELNWESIN